MSSNLILFLILALPATSFAGIETILFEEQNGRCTLRITHDATPYSEVGTILFRSFTVIDGLHFPCKPTKTQVTESLGRGIAIYRSQENLKPATSIMVERISRFPWVNLAWQAKAKSGTYEKMSNTEFNHFVGSKDISQPFEIALNQNGLEFDGASCEKIQFYENGHPMDALCWFKIKRT